MGTATHTPSDPTRADSLRRMSSADRLQLLRELVKLCIADGSLDKPLRVTDEGDPDVGIIAALYRRTTTPLPPMTDEERADLQRRIDNRHNAISHDEFVARVRKLIRELPETPQS